jgi:hypothetical protein
MLPVIPLVIATVEPQLFEPRAIFLTSEHHEYLWSPLSQVFENSTLIVSASTVSGRTLILMH